MQLEKDSRLIFILFSMISCSGSMLFGWENDPLDITETKIPEGYIVIEGDILIPEIHARGVHSTNLWTGGIVPYEFNDNVTPENQRQALEGMSRWEAVANVHFIPRTNETSYIHIKSASVNLSSVGMIGGMQTISLARWQNIPTIVHELGHALGLWHEHSRPDRDDYVTIIENNILKGYERNFTKRETADVYGDYDLASIMHYTQCGFSKCESCKDDVENCLTIRIRPPWDIEWQDKMGYVRQMSATDAGTMAHLYPDPEWIYVDLTYGGLLEMGTENNPYKSLVKGINNSDHGDTIMVLPGTYNEMNIFTKPIKIRAPLGDVIID